MYWSCDLPLCRVVRLETVWRLVSSLQLFPNGTLEYATSLLFLDILLYSLPDTTAGFACTLNPRSQSDLCHCWRQVTQINPALKRTAFDINAQGSFEELPFIDDQIAVVFADVSSGIKEQ